MIQRYAIVFALSTVAAALGGCHGMDVPADFVAMDRTALEGYEARAVSADGVVIALRTENNAKNGTLDFWASAVRNELVSARGYALAKEEPIDGAAGAGKCMIFTASRSGAEFTYIIAIFLRYDTILIAEAGGKTDAVTPKMGTILTALRSVR